MKSQQLEEEARLEEITSEKSLFTIYKRSREIKEPPFNVSVSLISEVLLILYVIMTSNSTSALAAMARSWAELGVTFTTTILGFLIAGFTLISTMTKKELWITMLKHREPTTNLPYLKYLFFMFMNVFIAYMVFTFTLIVFLLVGHPSGILSELAAAGAVPEAFAKRVCACSGIIIIGTGYVYSCLLLKSFIYNIYSLVMTTIRWEIEESEKQKREPSDVEAP